MVTTLHVKASGTVQLCKRPGAILENGSIIGKLTLDDPAQCKRAEVYDGPGFAPLYDEVPSKVMNLSQGFLHTRQILLNSLAGYCCPDRYFQETIEKTIDDFLSYLKVKMKH